MPQQKLFEFTTRIQKTKAEKKELEAMIKEAFASNDRWHAKNCEIKELVAQRKHIEDSILDDFRKEEDKIEVIKNEIDNDIQIRSDLALGELLKTGKIEPIEIEGVRYEAEIKVNFKKV
jgi:hypothetical protein